ncbi:hypothetical protein [Ruminococcus sp. NK3A76]|uniref:hypothetical protein n=1 Tax=Ruminococcus sp. NK3A76 TaxID=877411 RepID=UPI000AAE901C|nr:hypothetical protein [Ruminococcus sp. NK3A76]
MKSIFDETKQIVPYTVNVGEHPEMLIGTPSRDRRLDVADSCKYAVNDETFD